MYKQTQQDKTLRDAVLGGHGEKCSRNLLILAVAAALLLPLALASSNYVIFILCLVQLYIIAVSGLDVVFGYCGQISLGHAAFYAIGAYGSGLLHNFTGMPAIVTIVIASVAAALIGAALAYPASKLVFHFLSLATVAFGEIVYQVISHSPNNITGNFVGMFSGPISFFGYPINTNMRFYYFALACTVIFLVIKIFLVNSKVGRAFQAIRENTHAADGMGINVRKYKIISFTISAFYTAWAGGMYMHLVGYISPDTFMQRQSVLFLTMLLFGGNGSLLGPIIGVGAVMALTEALRSFQDYQMLIYGILMLLVIVALPGGLFGTIKRLVGRFRHKKLQVKSEGGGKNA